MLFRSDLKTGKTETVESQYLVACDGAGSMVREKLGITMTGNAVLTYTTNVIFKSRDLAKKQTIKHGYRYIFVGPEGTFATIVAIDGYDNYRFSLVGSGNRANLTDDDLRNEIRRAVAGECEIELLSTMPWTRRELVADKNGTKREFLVGDSAHQLSPTGAFGCWQHFNGVDVHLDAAGEREGLAALRVPARHRAVREVAMLRWRCRHLGFDDSRAELANGLEPLGVVWRFGESRQQAVQLTERLHDVRTV